MSVSLLKNIAVRAKKASGPLSLLSTEIKNRALLAMSESLLINKEFILKANAKDLVLAKKKGLASSLVARLTLTEAKLKGMADSIASISGLPDPVGRVISTTSRPNGLVIQKVGVPLGVILIIYESRPNVTADCMALCLKSGNSVILKGGSEARFSNRAVYDILRKAASKEGVPQDGFQFIFEDGRKAVKTLLTFSEEINLVIPRGGEGLIREVTNLSKIPVIKHTKGICHVFVDKDADLKKAEKIVINAKVQNPAVCNAMETLLVHENIANDFLPLISRTLQAKNVELRGCNRTRAVLPGIKRATEKDWMTEYLDLILSIRVVKNLEEAVSHIGLYGSQHSDAIVTENKETAEKFTHAVDSACVFVNASTRFADGGEFGMGAEMGISTDKLHARGPMGLEELTSYKYVVAGDGQVRE